MKGSVKPQGSPALTRPPLCPMMRLNDDRSRMTNGRREPVRPVRHRTVIYISEKAEDTMTEPSPSGDRWAPVSLKCSLLGWGVVLLILVGLTYCPGLFGGHDSSGFGLASAPLWLLILSVVGLWFSGIVGGIVALYRIRQSSGQMPGKGAARAAIALGLLPFVIVALTFTKVFLAFLKWKLFGLPE